MANHIMNIKFLLDSDSHGSRCLVTIFDNPCVNIWEGQWNLHSMTADLSVYGYNTPVTVSISLYYLHVVQPQITNTWKAGL